MRRCGDPGDSRGNRFLAISCMGFLFLVFAFAILVLIRIVPEEVAKAQSALTERLVAERAEELAAGVGAYRRDTGRLPTQLEDLVASEGPPGYAGPYFETLPSNPLPDTDEWQYDPRTGEVRDPTGRWSGFAAPPPIEMAGSFLDSGPLPRIAGPSLLSSDTVHIQTGDARTVLVYLFSDADPSLRSDWDTLQTLVDEEVWVFGVWIESRRYDRDRMERLVEAAHVTFPVLDATQDRDLWDALGVQKTPLLVVCDGLLTRRARLAGPVEPERLNRAIEEVWAVHELLWMGDASERF